MKHPTREEWMAYVYGELPTEGQADLEAHLHACLECQGTVGNWQSTMKDLDAWRLADSTPRRMWSAPLVRWGMAALFMLTLGFIGGQLGTRKPPEATRLAAALAPALRQQLQGELRADLRAALSGPADTLTNDFRRQLRNDFDQWATAAIAAASVASQQQLAQFAESYRTARADDRNALLAAYEDLERARRTDYAGLRRDLETVAIVSEDRYHRAQSEIGLLAAYAQPDSTANH